MDISRRQADNGGVAGSSGRNAARSARESATDRGDWWDYPGSEHAVSPVFELPDHDFVVSEISAKLQSGTLPLLEIPENIMRTLVILNNPDFRYEDIAAQIERSPGMTGEIIKLVNSPLFSHGQKIYDLWMAMPLLGHERIRSFLYMYSAQMNLRKIPLFRELTREIIEHSYAVALIAVHLARLGLADPDTAFLAGLFHDVGKLAILNSIADTCTLPADEGMTVSEDSFALIFPRLHEKAGVYIASHWGMDDIIKEVLLHHHDRHIDSRCHREPQEMLKLVNLIHVSDIMARMLGKGRSIGAINIFHDPAAKYLMLADSGKMRDYLRRVPEIIDSRFGSGGA